jgi:3-dehydroquinate synthase
MGEIIKHGLIKDRSYYKWLKDNKDRILSKEYDILAEMIYQSCRIKKQVVEIDPKEQGERALLNFGHTIGHSIEKLKAFSMLHGECVSIGMAAAAYISQKRGLINPAEYEDILQTIQAFKQPVSASALSAEEVLEVTKHDKKMDSDKIKFILLKSIGEAFIDTSVSREEMLEAIATVIK